MEETVADKVVKDISKDFMVRGNHRIHHWYAYAIIGVVLGMAGVMLYIANQNGQFDASQAAMPRVTTTANRPFGSANMEAGDIAVLDTFLGQWQASHKGQVPKIIVRPGSLVVRDGEENDTVKLGEPMTLPFNPETRNYLASLKEPYDVFFSSLDLKNRAGNLIFPGKTWQNTDFETMFNDPTTQQMNSCSVATSPNPNWNSASAVSAGACAPVKVVPYTCWLSGTFKIYSLDQTSIVTLSDQKGARCTSGKSGNAKCADAAREEALWQAALDYGISLTSNGKEAPAPESEEYAKFKENVAAYYLKASISSSASKNTSSCSPNRDGKRG